MPAKNNAPVVLTHDGKTLTVEEWSAATGIATATIRSRVGRLRWPASKALTTPAAKRFARSPGRPAGDPMRPVPAVKRHAKGLAYVTWMQAKKANYRYFGKWKSVEARAGYAKFIHEWADLIGKAKPVQATHEVKASSSVADIVGRWLDRCKERYVKFGKATSELHAHRSACAALGARFGRLATSAISVDHLETIRRDFVKRKLARKTVNKYVGCLVAAFGWGVGRKLVPADVHYSLSQIEPLAAGATLSPERDPIRSAPANHVAAVLAGEHLHADPVRRGVLAAMVRLQVLTGMRSGAICAMRPELVDRTGAEWKYTASGSGNKNYHREKTLTVWIGPQAQAVLLLLLEACEVGGQVFRFPRDRGPGWRSVTPIDYGRWIAAACDSAGVPRWTPHQLRHNRATNVKRIYESDEMAARAIGASRDVTERVYVDPQELVDRRIARETG